MQGALYFPFINVPDTSWWTRTLLYWDLVGTIVPDSYRQDPDLLDDFTLQLVRAGLVRQVFPSAAGRRLAVNFERYLNRLDDEEISRRRANVRRNQLTAIHKDKWLNYESGLRNVAGLGLAKPWAADDWAYVESQTAGEFMASLALTLCEEASQVDRQGDSSQGRWVPVTDQLQAATTLLAGLEPMNYHDPHRRIQLRVKGEFRAAEIRTGLLEELLPVPDQAPALDEIVRFRAKHENLLPLLRRYLEDRIDEIMAIDDVILRTRKLDRIAEETEERVKQAEVYLGEAGFRRIRRSSLLRFAKVVPFLKDFVEVAQETAASAESQPKFESEPLAYLAFARLAFNVSPRYGLAHETGIPALTEEIAVPAARW